MEGVSIPSPLGRVGRGPSGRKVVLGRRRRFNPFSVRARRKSRKPLSPRPRPTSRVSIPSPLGRVGRARGADRRHADRHTRFNPFSVRARRKSANPGAIVCHSGRCVSIPSPLGRVGRARSDAQRPPREVRPVVSIPSPLGRVGRVMTLDEILKEWDERFNPFSVRARRKRSKGFFKKG